MSRNWSRTVIAVLAALVFPGLGHLYLRRWLRGLLWALGVMAVAAAILETPPESMGVFEGAMAVARRAPPEVRFGLFALVVVNAVDAGVLSRRETDADSGSESDPGDDTIESCPNCGKDLDEDLDFCPWCTTRFDESGDPVE